MITLRLRHLGFRDNHKRVYRIYCEEGLQVMRRQKRKKPRARGPKANPTSQPDERWALDFVSDQLVDGRSIRALTIVDVFTRECLAIEVDTSLSGERVARVLDRLIECRGKPSSIITDNGPEFTSKAMTQWGFQQQVEHHFITPGKPTENCYVESFNGTFRDESLNENWFTSIEEAKTIIEEWRQMYNQIRPHSSVGKVPPEVFAAELPPRGKKEDLTVGGLSLNLIQS